jgi:hypothetical protein
MMPCILNVMASVFTSRMASTKGHLPVQLSLTSTWNMSLQRYSSDVLDLKSGTSYTILVTVSQQHLQNFFATLHEVSHGYELIINPTKHMIFAMKNHHKITNEM